MKVALCFWGLTRSLKYTIESIKQNIFQPLDDGHIEYKIFVHTFFFNSIYNNPRANERNITLDFDEYSLLINSNSHTSHATASLHVFHYFFHTLCKLCTIHFISFSRLL